MSELGARGLGSLVERRRLLERLAGAGTPAVLLHAPAGYGKSVLLAQWAAGDRRPFASVVLTPAHDDPAVLLDSVIEAMAPIDPLPETISSTLQAPKPDLDVIARRLQAALAARETDSVLVLDELEHVSSPGSRRLLEAIVAGMEDGCQVAFASRERNLPGAAKLLASRQLTVLEATDLTMTPGEAGELVAGVGLEASGAELEALMEKTEGWAAGLYLAALALREREEPDRIAGFAGDERTLVDYMRDEFLAQAPAEDVELLLGAALLDRFCGELCDALLGRHGSAAKLAELARGNMLLTPLDRRDEWFRMHSLFAEMLRSELRRRRPEELPELYSRASAWWAEHGDPARAVGFALEAGDLERAGKLIWASVPAYNATGRYATIERWIERAGEERVLTDPHFSLTMAHGHLSRGEGADAEHWANVTRELLAAGAEVDATVVAGLAMVDGALARHGVIEMEAAAALGAEALPSASPWTSMANLIAGAGAQLAGDRDRARELLADSARRAATRGVTIIQVLALAQLALLAAAEEDWQTASILTSQARAQIDRTALGSHPTMALPIAASAYVRAAERRSEEAGADLRAARALLEELDAFGDWYVTEVCATLAATAVALGDRALAREMLERARIHLARVPDAPLLDNWVAGIAEAARQLATGGGAELTPAELRVLRLLPTHLSFPQIAAELVVSPNTVKTQARAAYRKLGVSSRREAVDRAREAGLLDAEDTAADGRL